MFDAQTLINEVYTDTSFVRDFSLLQPLINFEADDAGIDLKEWKFTYAMHKSDDSLYSIFYHPVKMCFWIMEFEGTPSIPSGFSFAHSYFMNASDFKRRNAAIFQRILDLKSEAVGFGNKARTHDLRDVLDDDDGETIDWQSLEHSKVK